MAKPKDITGNKYGKLTALYLDHRNKYVKNNKTLVKSYWKCKCECGKECVVELTQLTCGKTKSCGCYQQECRGKSSITHGDSKTPFYRCYKKIKERCLDVNNKSYKDYGGRGIKCEWNTYEEFKNDMYESYLQAKELYDDVSIDRIDFNGNYCKNNCRWTDRITQNNNKRNVIKVTKDDGTFTTFTYLSKELGISRKTLHTRYRKSKYNGTGSIPYSELIKETDFS